MDSKIPLCEEHDSQPKIYVCSCSGDEIIPLCQDCLIDDHADGKQHNTNKIANCAADIKAKLLVFANQFKKVDKDIKQEAAKSVSENLKIVSISFK
jgi:hypothetical protein